MITCFISVKHCFLNEHEYVKIVFCVLCTITNSGVNLCEQRHKHWNSKQ